MAPKNTPSFVMYAVLKRLGVSNRDAAEMLLNTQLTFDGHPLKDRIVESSQLSRRIVNTSPGELPRGLFGSFQTTCPCLAQAIIEKRAVARFRGNEVKATKEAIDELSGRAADEMMDALAAFGIDGSIYRNMIVFIDRADLAGERERMVLHLMMLVVTGCLGNPKTASIMATDYAIEVLGADFQTAQTVICAIAQPVEIETEEPLLGLVRVVDGRIKAGTTMHVLNPDGTEIGLMPKARHTISDVGEDVSRRHARIWREDSRWFIEGLGSTNGTTVVAGATGEETVVEPSRSQRDKGIYEAHPAEIRPTDLVNLGTTTTFMVMPVLGS